MTTIYFELRYCSECCCEHWLEVTRTGLEICHGEDRHPINDQTHYTRRLGHGFEEVENKPQPLPLAWQMANEARESAER